MKYTKFLKRLLCSIMSVITFVTALNGSVIKASAVTSMAMSDFSEIVSTYNIDSSIPSYKTYLEMHQGASYPDIEVVIPAGGFTRYEENGSAVTPDVFADFEGASGASVLTSEDSLIEFGVDIPESGFYNLTVTYYSVAGKNSDIERSFFINGALPFKELNQANFTRVWKNVAVDTALNDQGVNKKIWAYDNQGNHIKPNVIEIPEWQDRFVYDSNGYITKPLHIYFDAGYNTISMLSRKEPMLINKLTLSNQGILRGYDEVKAQWDLEGAKQTGGHHILIEAEYATKTSSQMLYPQQDQISPAISPVSARELLNNSIGGISWSHAGQWVEWEFSVPESGYYHISMFNCQNFVRGVHVSRRVYINGEIPFAEMSEYAFHYKQNYREDVFSDSDGNPYLFYLEAGSHTI
ncbi:MAG: ABC transporter substrate-binding protein, partial [Lachnospiraceae bacterium]|nr:ABC transporter substrate-binding protein [Lachnospiraceae bacterium]